MTRDFRGNIGSIIIFRKSQTHAFAGEYPTNETKKKEKGGVSTKSRGEPDPTATQTSPKRGSRKISNFGRKTMRVRRKQILLRWESKKGIH